MTYPTEVDARTTLDDRSCRHLTAALEFMGRRWNGGVLLALGCGAERFSEVLRAVPGLSDRMLAARLKELETHGAIVRTVTPTVPVQVRYRLSPYGEKLLDAVLPLIEVGRAMGQARAETLERRSA